eukprot:PITA_15866
MELYVFRLPRHAAFLFLTACCAFLTPYSLSFDAQYEYCLNTSNCGSMNLTYPFGVGKRGCGHPGVQINCLQNSSPVIEIHAQNYTLQGARSPNFLVVRDQNCNYFDHSNNNLQMPFSQYGDAIFDILGKENRTLNVYKCNIAFQDAFDYTKGQLWICNATVYCDFFISAHSIRGCSMKQVVVEIGIARYISRDTKRDKDCKSCAASGGLCGYNISDSTSPFLCYCKDGPRIDKCHGHGPLNKSAVMIITGCSVGVTFTAVALVLFLTFYMKKRHPSPGSSAAKVEKFLKEYAYEMPMRYSFSHLKKITNNFEEKLGEGGYGVVYKGKLNSNGAPIAVKILDRHRHSEAQFMNEVATIGRVRHVNLVKLLGYCFESPISALVYEYMLNGSLDKFLFAREERGHFLRWGQLHSIALGSARGIAYLHQDCEKRIIHFDIKPHNILLNADFTPKVSDFGLAMLCGKEDDHISMTARRGTPGYVAPEMCYSNMGPVTDKSDVYSFGMLLLEIVGVRKNINSHVSRSSRLYFPQWVVNMLQNENEELQMRLRGGVVGEIETDTEAAAKRLMTKVGLWCIQYESKDRPCMSRVVQMLDGSEEDVDNPPFPLRSSSATPEIPLLSFAQNTSYLGGTL